MWPPWVRCTFPLHAHRLLNDNKLRGKVPSEWIPFLQGLSYRCLAAGRAHATAFHVALQACVAFALPGSLCATAGWQQAGLCSCVLVWRVHACMLRSLGAWRAGCFCGCNLPARQRLSFCRMVLLPLKRAAAFSAAVPLLLVWKQSACAVLCSLSLLAQTGAGADV
jgi:hypothetical protein